MGEHRNRKQRLLAVHPHCIYCGGTVSATTIEHCPPRALFINKNGPEGFEFPACADCNHGSSDDDLLVSLLSRMDPVNNTGDLDGKTSGYLKQVNRQFPEFLREMMISPSEARKFNREAGIRPHPGMTHQEMGAVRIPKRAHEAIHVFAKKLAKSLYFKHSAGNRVFPSEGCLMLNWFTNANVLKAQGESVFDLMRHFAAVKPTIERAGQKMSDQFDYKFTMSDDDELFVIQAKFRFTFGLVLFGSIKPGVIETIAEKLSSETGRKGPFSILQSKLLPTVV